MMRIVALLGLVLGSFFTLLAQDSTHSEPRLQGLLWEISGNGIAKNGYLYGTMHVPRKLAFNLSDTFFLALQTVDVVALETDHDQWQSFSKEMEDFERSQMQGRAREANFFDFSLQLGDLYGRYFDFHAPENSEFAALLSTKPAMSNELMYRSSSYGQDYEEDTYLDQFIFQSGKKLGKTVIGLETLEGSYGAAMRSRLPDDDAKDQKYSYNRGARGGIEEAYRNQDLTALDSINQLSNPSKNFQKYMLDIRNVVHADGIDSILQAGSAIFAAVGAAHLPGQTGVIKLLKEKGYTLRPVVFTMSPQNIELKTKLEELKFPVNMQAFSPEDSTWSAKAPGPFFESTGRDGLKQFLCADMANGAYFAVYRMKTFGIWEGQTPDYISNRIDSLIYESTPGKIQERSRFDGPIPGHTITTRTRRGDIQRFKLYVLPNEVLLFTTSGIGDFALGEEADTFMESIEIKPFRRGKGNFTPKFGGYSIDFPAPMIDATADLPDAELHYAAAYDAEKDAYYSLYRVHYPDFSYIEEDSFELNIICEKISEKFTKTPPNVELISLHPNPTQDFSFQSDTDSSYYFGRLIIHGSAYYLLTSRQKENLKPTAFFKSFVFENALYGKPFATQLDTTLQLKVETIERDKIEEKPFFKEFSLIMSEIEEKNRDLYGEKADVEEMKTGSITLYDKNSSQEVVYIIRESMKSMAFIPTVDSFQNFVRNLVTVDQKMAIKSEQWSPRKANYLAADFMVQDTNSNRCIMHKIVAQNSSVYRLVSLVNLDKKPSAFIQKAFDTFESTDTVFKALQFGKRDVSFLENLYHQDSLECLKAKQELKTKGRTFYENEDFGLLKKAVSHPKFDSLKTEEKEDLLHAFGGLNSKLAVDFLSQFYQNHADSALLQVAALSGLSRIQTKYGFDRFFSLVHEKNAFLGNYFSFASANDSLELTAKFAKEIVALSKSPTYKVLAVRLLGDMYQKGLIKPKVFKSLKQILLSSVARSFKERQYQAEKEDQDKNRYSSYNANIARNLQEEIDLLQPFLKKDKAVRAMFDEVLAHGDRASKIVVYSLYLKEGLPVPMVGLEQLANDRKTKYLTFKNLAEAKQITPYKQFFVDTLALMESLAFASEKDLDSLKFTSKHKAVFENRPATLFFFDAKAKKSKDWGLISLRVPNDLASYLAEPKKSNYRRDEYPTQDSEDFVETLFELSGAKKEEFIKKKVAEIRFVNRERYRSRSRYDYEY